MNVRVTNTALLLLLAALTFTGAYGIVWPLPGWMYEAHRVSGFAFIALLPWKIGIALRSLGRGFDRRFDRSLVVGVSLLLASAALAVLILGLAWAANVLPGWRLLGDTAISWHWMIALGLLPILALHLWRRWPRPKARELISRRAALRYLGWGAAGLAGWGAIAWLARSRETPGARRTVTGSREQGSFAGNSFPVTNGYGEGRNPVDAAAWTFSLVGAVEKPIYLSYAAFLARPAREFAATLDCTTGWYSSQVWTGVPLAELLDEVGLAPSANAIRLIAATGYAAEYPLDEAQTLFLATHVGGEVLDRWHGFPLRVVAPTRRGWQWVKWLTAVEVRAGPGAVAPARFNNLAFAADPLSATRFGLAHVPPLNSRL